MSDNKMKRLNSARTILILLVSIMMVVIGAWLLSDSDRTGGFNSRRALQDVETQLSFGPRTPGSLAHQQARDWMLAELEVAGWQTDTQSAVVDGHEIRNLVAKKGSGVPWYMLGAHYDSRMIADHDADPARQLEPVPGANDGASGVAVLLELARSLPDDLAGQVWLVFFDAEDQGKLPGWDWILGSRYFASRLDGTPDGVVVVDMIGDVDLMVFKERNSSEQLNNAIWNTADQAGFGNQFPSEYKYSMLDDHTPFIERGIPTALLIDFDYPWWHTSGDTLDKVSAESLNAVGMTLYNWLVDVLGD